MERFVANAWTTSSPLNAFTPEATFYRREDNTESFAATNDPVWREKDAFIKEQRLVVWRFHDHWHMRPPDGILTGVADAFGWNRYQRSDVANLFVLPQMKLRELAKSGQERIGIKVVRVVVNPDLEATKVVLVPGAAGRQRHLQFLRRDDVEVLVIGEVPESETIE